MTLKFRLFDVAFQLFVASVLLALPLTLAFLAGLVVGSW